MAAEKTKPVQPVKGQFGVVGLGVMGANLALNVEDHGFPVVVYNRTWDRTEEFLAQNPGKRLIGAKTYAEFAAALETPRRILLMVKAGEATDATINSIKPFLEPGAVSYTHLTLPTILRV